MGILMVCIIAVIMILLIIFGEDDHSASIACLFVAIMCLIFPPEVKNKGDKEKNEIENVREVDVSVADSTWNVMPEEDKIMLIQEYNKKKIIR